MATSAHQNGESPQAPLITHDHYLPPQDKNTTNDDNNSKGWWQREKQPMEKITDYLEDKTRDGFILSKRSWKIYVLFLIPPFFITLLWLFIPLQHYGSYCFAISVYYTMAFFAWLSFYSIFSVSGFNYSF